MSIHEHLPPQARKDLKEVGWTKGLELAKVARAEGSALRLCNLVAQGPLTAKGGVQAGGREGTDGTRDRAAARSSTSSSTRARSRWSSRHLRQAVLMLGTDRSRGYCLEMICAEFVAGASLESGNPESY